MITINSKKLLYKYYACCNIYINGDHINSTLITLNARLYCRNTLACFMPSSSFLLHVCLHQKYTVITATTS